MPSLFLGRNLLYWCKICNVPIIDSKTCPNCQNNTFLVKISPPYDCRPAFSNDIKRIKTLIETEFGPDCSKIIEDEKVIILNKVAYEDRMDEIVIDGQVIGFIRYNVLNLDEKWEFIPKPEGARRILQHHPKSWIKVEDDAVQPIIKGANLFIPGIIDHSKNIKKGDITFILTKEGALIGQGFAQLSSEEISTQKKGMAVKIKYKSNPKDPQILSKGQNWDLVVQINESILHSKEYSIINYINKVTNKYNIPKLMSFSGGKDSLALLLLLIKSGIDFQLFFIDTGIEFKETVEYVNYIVRKFNLEDKFLKYESKNNFYTEARENFGPPAKDFRWCCKVVKLSNINDLIRDNFPQGVLTFVGNRKYESFLRRDESRKGKITRNSYIPSQMNVNLINNWNALMVWLYIFKAQMEIDLKINPLYELGYERVGCIPCPANKLSDIELLKENFPEEYQLFFSMLKEHAEKNNYPQEWITLGLWRWKNLPKSQMNLLKKFNLEPIKVKYGSSDDLKLDLKYTIGASSCQDGSVILEGKFNQGLDLERLTNFLSIFGRPMLNLENGLLNIRKDMTLINFFADGSLNIRMYEGNESKLIDILKEIFPLILKAQKCIGCGICIEMCPSEAILIEDQLAWIKPEKCNKCLKCLKRCPILDYSYKDVFKSAN
ncbi:MAG: 4Fe-4S dicluster domain-containing protein [Candidatus Lokiarchaeota archaeon]|nr:4Fe-4S dicluster domain-containing protein [Candidatus Lokiarchaeota archaeon]